MHRLLVVALAVAAVVLPGSAAADNPKLFGSVGPGFTISLEDASGNPVKHVDAGTYDVVVQDLAAEHDFHLFGPGVDKSTDVEFTGTTTTTTSPPPPRPKRLVASVGPGYTISLRNPAGRSVSTLEAGKYAITVRDRSSSHDFHLVGPGVNRKTGVAFKGTVTWTVTLKKGVLRFRCDPHATLMHGSVKVI